MSDWQIQEDEQGWSSTDRWVCTECVSDYALRAAIEAAAEQRATCSFCGSLPAAPLDSLMEVFVSGIRTEFDDAVSVLFYDGREGGFQGPVIETWDLLDDVGDVLVGPGLLEAVRGSMHDRAWVDTYFVHPSEDEALSWSWGRFRHAVLHETRYVFWLRQDEDEEELRSSGEIPTAKILQELGRLVGDLDLLRVLDAGSRFCRARAHKIGDKCRDAKELGTVPINKAGRSSRMSPAGIPMFYGAEDTDTALLEVAAATNKPIASFGWFETSRPCTVVDFTNLPTVPSMFDLARTAERHGLMFLHAFVRELTQRPRHDFAEVDYVPTQIVTEYLLKVYLGGETVEGLLYPSSLTGRACVVLDVENARCVELSDGWQEAEVLLLGLDRKSINIANLPELPDDETETWTATDEIEIE